ncbi:TetR/AcrR family transcriptional regulator [Trujillonella humicola]|uniref:TetR/AcrR family transcriptional regulator n=1 Tax=Trujillonella humicola TaxID=3383699 RepID=UPI0039060A76
MTRPRFSRADVVTAGVAITAERGLSSLTLNAVAERLGVQRPSLYHHLPGGVDELRNAVIDAVTAVEPAEDDEAEADLMATEERSLRRMAVAMGPFPDVIAYLATEGRDGHRPLQESDRLARLLLAQELDTSPAEAFVIAHAYLVGWICALRQDAGAAETAGMPVLAQVLRDAEDLDRGQVLMRGFRALLAGLGASPGSPPNDVPTAAEDDAAP